MSPWGAIHWENRVSAPHLLGRRRKVQKPLIWIVRYAPENRGEQAPLVHGIGSATQGKQGGNNLWRLIQARGEGLMAHEGNPTPEERIARHRKIRLEKERKEQAEIEKADERQREREEAARLAVIRRQNVANSAEEVPVSKAIGKTAASLIRVALFLGLLAVSLSVTVFFPPLGLFMLFMLALVALTAK